MCFADLSKSLDTSIIMYLTCLLLFFVYQKGLDKVHLSAVIVFDHQVPSIITLFFNINVRCPLLAVLCSMGYAENSGLAQGTV